MSEVACPVYPCTQNFQTIDDLSKHLLHKHKRSVKKHSLTELLEFASHFRGCWYFDNWRDVAVVSR